MNNDPDSKKKSSNKITFWTAFNSTCGFLALLISLFVLFSGYGENGIFPVRKVNVLPQSGFYVLRGFNNSESDYIVLPVNWETKGNRITSLQEVYLWVKDTDNPETNTYLFRMVGEFESISYGDFSNLSLGNTVNLDPQTISTKNLLFKFYHVATMSNQERPKLDSFQFPAVGDYKFVLSYSYNDENSSAYLFGAKDFGSLVSNDNSIHSYPISSWYYYDLNELDRIEYGKTY